MLIDVFRQDPFTAIALTLAVERNPYIPTGIGALNIFDDAPQFTKTVMVESRTGQLVIIPTSPRGAPPTERVTERRNAKAFIIPRIAHGDTLMADEIDGIRAFGEESELEVAQSEIARRLSGPTGLLSNIEFTWERHRLAAIQGVLLDADGSVIYNFFEEFSITPPAEIGFGLQFGSGTDEGTSVVPGSLRMKVNSVVRAMARAAKGAFTSTTKIYAACGDAFWDALMAHPDVTSTYLNQIAAQELREQQAFQTLSFGGIQWFNYRGSDDNSTIAIQPDKVKFFPVGARGVFQVCWGPGETFDFVNTRGRPTYVLPIFDRDRNAWWRMEAYSYPLHMCTRPEVLFSGRLEP